MTTFLLGFGLVPLALFIYRYWAFSPWMATFQGRTLMSQKIAWFLLLTHFFIESWFTYPGHDVIELVLISLCVLLFWITLWGLLLAQDSIRPVSKKRGSGYVENVDLAKTNPRSSIRPPTRRSK